MVSSVCEPRFQLRAAILVWRGMGPGGSDYIALTSPLHNYTAVQNQNAVYAYFTSNYTAFWLCKAVYHRLGILYISGRVLPGLFISPRGQSLRVFHPGMDHLTTHCNSAPPGETRSHHTATPNNRKILLSANSPTVVYVARLYCWKIVRSVLCVISGNCEQHFVDKETSVKGNYNESFAYTTRWPTTA